MTTGYTPEGYQLAMIYDAANRMKTAAYNDGTSHLFQYSYAGNSLLAEVIKDGSTTKYLRSGFLPIQERDGSNSITREYTWGKNLEGGIGGLLNLKQGGQDYSYLYDGKGNVSALIDSTQSVVASYAYDPFGMLMKKSGTLDQPYTFSTKEVQPGTGQYYYGYRFYDSCSGKWTTRDPLGEAGGVNLYGAMGNNAANWVDPIGLEKDDWWDPDTYTPEALMERAQAQNAAGNNVAAFIGVSGAATSCMLECLSGTGSYDKPVYAAPLGGHMIMETTEYIVDEMAGSVARQIYVPPSLAQRMYYNMVKVPLLKHSIKVGGELLGVAGWGVFAVETGECMHKCSERINCDK